MTASALPLIFAIEASSSALRSPQLGDPDDVGRVLLTIDQVELAPRIVGERVGDDHEQLGQLVAASFASDGLPVSSDPAHRR